MSDAGAAPAAPAPLRTFEVPSRIDDPPDPDPDLASVPKPSLLDNVRARLTAATEARKETWQVPERPGFAVRYRCHIDESQLDAWGKLATDKETGEVSRLRLSAIALANLCDAILCDGEVATLDGEPLVFASRAFMKLYEVDRAADAVVAFYANDANVLAVAGDVGREAGWGAPVSRVDRVDPT